ncbi:MAG: ribose ABC transporter permease [Firmicutes bacterium]|nr:ribose ABC transporter permease [Bacillota bacterium]
MKKRFLLELLRKYGMLIILLCIIIVISILSDRFLTLSNFLVITRQVTINGIVAAGMTVVILSGGIDLSVGAVIALSGALSAGLLASTNNWLLGILMGLFMGALFGAFNGVLVAHPKLPPFIVTLATMALARGLTLVYTGGRPILVNNEIYESIGGGYIRGVPVPVVIMAVIYVLMYIVLKNHRFGRLVYAIGGNEEACRLSGINVERVKIGIYTLSGLMAGLTGVVLTSRLISAQPTAGSGYELDAIAAVILGGTSLSGGQGHIGGTIIGAFIIGVLSNGLNLLNVSPFYQDVAKGLVILMAVLLDRLLYATGSVQKGVVS